MRSTFVAANAMPALSRFLFPLSISGQAILRALTQQLDATTGAGCRQQRKRRWLSPSESQFYIQTLSRQSSKYRRRPNLETQFSILGWRSVCYRPTTTTTAKCNSMFRFFITTMITRGSRRIHDPAVKVREELLLSLFRGRGASRSERLRIDQAEITFYTFQCRHFNSGRYPSLARSWRDPLSSPN